MWMVCPNIYVPVYHATDKRALGSIMKTGLTPGGPLGSGERRGELHCSLIDPVAHRCQFDVTEYDCYGVARQPYNFKKEGKGKGKSKDKKGKGKGKHGSAAGGDTLRGDKVTDACIIVNYRRAYDHGVRFVQTHSNGIVTDGHVPYHCLDGWIDVATMAFAPWAWPSINAEGEQTYIDLTDEKSSAASGDTAQSSGNVSRSGENYKKIFDKALNAGAADAEEQEMELQLEQRSIANIERQ